MEIVNLDDMENWICLCENICVRYGWKLQKRLKFLKPNPAINCYGK